MALLRKKMPTLIFEIPERKKLQGSSTEQSARSAHFFLDFKNTVTPISISNFLSEKLVPAPGPAGAPVIYIVTICIEFGAIDGRNLELNFLEPLGSASA